MKKILPILLLGCLSMLFAEIFSGASQIWFINPFGLAITFPIYLLHTILLLCLALRLKKTSLTVLYFFGVIFSLYEAFITKVLWEGYIGQEGSGLGHIFSLSIVEFPILVFFWHPIMSFILPVLVYQIMTKQILIEHSDLLTRTKKKTAVIIAFLILVSPSIAKGNSFDIVSSNIALVGTIVITLILIALSKKQRFSIDKFKGISMAIPFSLLCLIYILSFFYLLPERIPKEKTAYISIAVCYAVAIFFVLLSRKTYKKVIELDSKHYSLRDLLVFFLITIASVNLANVFYEISEVIIIITYVLLSMIGIMMFIVACLYTVKVLLNKKLTVFGEENEKI